LIELKNMIYKKIGICHYRIGKTDGVSLEISKRKKVLEKLGHTIKLISGPKQINADYIIPELEFDRKDILKIKENAFFEFEDYNSENDLLKDIYKTANIIKSKFLKIHQKEKFDCLILHNIFSHGRHIAAAKAFYDISQETNIKIIGFNHDFYFAGSYKDIYKPQTPGIKKYLKLYVPPKTNKIKHITINSINQKILLQKTGLKSIISPDVFDFKQKKWSKDSYNKDFLNQFKIKENDLIILQATRIVERKGIELTIDLVKEIQKRKNELIDKKLYNNKIINKDSKIILLLTGYTEPASKEYGRKIKEKVKKSNIKAKFIHKQIDSKRYKKNNKKIYSLWDAYAHADMVTFPSIWEGWGNQFIEAIFAKKPIIVFEYPVFKKDIKPEGFYIISLGDKIKDKYKNEFYRIPEKNIKRAANKSISWLTNKNTNYKLDENFEIGKKFHGYQILEEFLIKNI